MRLDWSPRVRLGVYAGLALAIGAVVWLLAPSGHRAIPVLTGILVLVTAVYADRTHEMVREMRAARAAQIQPRLIVTMDRFAQTVVTPRILSVGAGPAFDVNVTLRLEPDGPSGPYIGSVLGVGRGQSLIFRDAAGKVLAKVDDFKPYAHAHLEGSCKDALGSPLKVDETLDLAAYIAGYEDGLWKTPGGTRREGRVPLQAIEEILDLIEHHIRLMVQPE